MWFWILSIGTIIYVAFSAYQDLKERMIYCVPCYLLIILWGLYLCTLEMWKISFLVVFWGIHGVVYGVMNYFKIWGGGDSDFIFLFANVYLTTVGYANGYVIAVNECICLCIALLMSIAIGWIEGKIKGFDVNLQSKVAVIPGMAILQMFLIFKEMIVRWQM